MRYRIKERVNLLTNKQSYLVEQFSELDNSWVSSLYYDEDDEVRVAVFDIFVDALAYAKNGGVIGERIIWEGNDDE